MVTASQPVTDTQWQAILERDRNADGGFVYGVITTGIFCRPSCPARRPNVENVRIFPDGTAALQAGFRPCRRCTPLSVAGSPVTATVTATVTAAPLIGNLLSVEECRRDGVAGLNARGLQHLGRAVIGYCAHGKLK